MAIQLHNLKITHVAKILFYYIRHPCTTSFLWWPCGHAWASRDYYISYSVDIIIDR
jgi:hypothetical protein